MKYIIKSLYGFGQMKLWPGDDIEGNGGDRVFHVTWEPSDEDEERMSVQEYLDAPMPDVLYIPASEFYQFMDNIRTWAPDMRKKESEGGRE